MFEVIRIIVYAVVLYNIYFVSSGWVTVGFAAVFAMFEGMWFVLKMLYNFIGDIKKQLNSVNTNVPQSDSLGTLETVPVVPLVGLGFSSEELTTDEEALAHEIKLGNAEAATFFLYSRCGNKNINFSKMPEELRLILASKLIENIKEDTKNRITDNWDEDILDD